MLRKRQEQKPPEVPFRCSWYGAKKVLIGEMAADALGACFGCGQLQLQLDEYDHEVVLMCLCGGPMSNADNEFPKKLDKFPPECRKRDHDQTSQFRYDADEAWRRSHCDEEAESMECPSSPISYNSAFNEYVSNSTSTMSYGRH